MLTAEIAVEKFIPTPVVDSLNIFEKNSPLIPPRDVFRSRRKCNEAYEAWLEKTLDESVAALLYLQHSPIGFEDLSKPKRIKAETALKFLKKLKAVADYQGALTYVVSDYPDVFSPVETVRKFAVHAVEFSDVKTLLDLQL